MAGEELWWENRVFPPPHRTAFRRADARRRTIFPCAIFFPSPAPSSLHTLFPHAHPYPRTASFLYSIFLFSIFLNSCSDLDFLRPQFESLSLYSHLLPTLLISRTATNAALTSCKCVNRVFSPHRLGDRRISTRSNKGIRVIESLEAEGLRCGWHRRAGGDGSRASVANTGITLDDITDPRSPGGVHGSDAWCVCNLLFINRYMRPGGPWQRLAAALADSSGIFVHDLILAQTDNRQF